MSRAGLLNRGRWVTSAEGFRLPPKMTLGTKMRDDWKEYALTEVNGVKRIFSIVNHQVGEDINLLCRASTVGVVWLITAYSATETRKSLCCREIHFGDRPTWGTMNEGRGKDSLLNTLLNSRRRGVGIARMATVREYEAVEQTFLHLASTKEGQFFLVEMMGKYRQHRFGN